MLPEQHTHADGISTRFRVFLGKATGCSFPSVLMNILYAGVYHQEAKNYTKGSAAAPPPPVVGFSSYDGAMEVGEGVMEVNC